MDQIPVEKNSEVPPNITCKICKVPLNPREHLNHFNTCHLKITRKLRCDQCNQNFTSKAALSSHILQHESINTKNEEEIVKKFKCPYCDRHFQNEGVILLHISLLHPDLQAEHLNLPEKHQNIAENKNLNTNQTKENTFILNSELNKVQITIKNEEKDNHKVTNVNALMNTGVNKVEINIGNGENNTCSENRENFNVNKRNSAVAKILDNRLIENFSNNIKNHIEKSDFNKLNCNLVTLEQDKCNNFSEQHTILENILIENETFSLENSDKMVIDTEFMQTNNYNEIENLSNIKQSTEINNIVNINISGKKNVKLSQIFTNNSTEILYSSDSDCEYEIIKTAVKIDNKKADKQCKVCQKRFSLKENLEKHFQKHNVIEINDLQIHNFKNARHDNSNLQNVIDNQNIDKQKSNLENVLEPNDLHKQNLENLLQNKNLQCSICPRKYKFAANLENHLKTHVVPCSSNSTKTKENCDKIVIKSTRLACNICRKVFVDLLKYENHLEFHKKSGEVTENSETLTEKNKSLHECMHCNQTFTTSSHLKDHKKTHFNDKNHVCTTCDKSFTLKKYLVSHMKKHTNETNYICEYCNKSFSAKGNYTEHLRIHTGEKPYSCSKCDKQFSHNSGLTQHLKTHGTSKNYNCDTCGKSFRWNAHFKMHLKKHLGEKAFKCKNCEKSFVNKSALVVHERTHTGERPYKCISCLKGFIKNSGLQQHYKSHPEHKKQTNP